MAASWDPALIQHVGAALGAEVKAKGRHMLLGPCININRVPQGCRDFESFGEDPWLTSRMAVAYVLGIQNQGVAACTKHYACNNQEYERDVINVRIDERTLREIYLPGFEAAVREGGSWSVMAAYNKVNGAYCSENPHLLTDILKTDWGFRGLAISDWGAVHSTVPTVNAGLDLEMPTGMYLNASVLEAVRRGEIRESKIDGMVRRLLRVMSWLGILGQKAERPAVPLDPAAHRSLALQVAREGMVLLKNDGSILPLDRKLLKSVAVIGPGAATARVGGGGSSKVDPVLTVSVLEGLEEVCGASIRITYAAGCMLPEDLFPIDSSALFPPEGEKSTHGLKGEYFANKDLQGNPVVTRIDKQVNFIWGDGAPAPGIPVDGFSARWTGRLVPQQSGRYFLSTRTDDGARLFLDGKLVIDDWKDHAPETHRCAVELVAGRAYTIRMEYYENAGGASAELGWQRMDEDLLKEAVETARKADAAVVCVGSNDEIESEGKDRENIDLSSEQKQLIVAVARANPRTIVVLTTGAPVLMHEWLDAVPAVVESWFPGQEGGTAVAEVLTGAVNPSGKLPVTFPKAWEDCPAFSTYPGTNRETNYAEGVFVGYRHFDAKGIEPLFPFGFGLSYTRFAYENLEIKPSASDRTHPLNVQLTVRNTGSREGAEVVQLYVGPPATRVPRPPQELKSFERVTLKAGESKRINLTVSPGALGWYDVNAKKWVVDPGKYTLLVGSSSRDIRLKGNVELH
jgi:beta-glucosidase